MRRDMKRAESMKVDLKKPKRTPSFTTRRRTQSFRKQQKLENMEDLPPVEVNGYLERKQELQSGGKKAPVRSWKNFYTVLCGQLLCFFKDAEDFVNSKAASSPVSILKARVAHAQDYTKRKYVFRLTCTDGSEYLFLANTDEEMNDWINKIAFHAQLPPSLQLLSYDDTQKVCWIMLYFYFAPLSILSISAPYLGNCHCFCVIMWCFFREPLTTGWQ